MLKGLFFFLIMILSALRAEGQTAPPVVDGKAEAGRLYKEGVELFKTASSNKELYKQALEKFQAAYNLDPSPILLFNMARAAEEGGDPSKAIEYYRTYITRFPQAEDAQRVQGRIDVYEKSLPKAKTCTLTLRDIPADATVKIHGKLIEKPMDLITTDCFEQAVQVFDSKGKQIAGGRVAAQAANSKTEWVYEPTVPVIGVATPPVQPLPTEKGWGRKEWSYVAFGGAGAAAIGATVLGVMMKGKFSDAEKQHNNPKFTREQVNSSLETGKGYQTGMFIFTGFAIAALGAAIPLFITDTSSEESPSPPIVSPSTNGASVQLRW